MPPLAAVLRHAAAASSARMEERPSPRQFRTSPNLPSPHPSRTQPRSLTELRLSVQHPPLALTEAHAEQLERALPHLARLTVHRVEDADTGTLARQAAALDLLARMLGGGLVLEAEPRVFPLLPP